MDARKLLRWLDTRDPGFDRAFAAFESRRTASLEEVDSVVAGIVDDVRQRGDAAVLDVIERVDGYRLTPGQLEVTRAEIDAAAARLTDADRAAIERAADRVRRFHAHHVPASWSFEDGTGRLGQLVRPLERVGIYAPAGQAPLASTVLMLAVPAAVAGVGEVVLATPGRELHPAMLWAASVAGVSRVFRIGGAQAIAALAYGTASVPRVDKIVGPGSNWVQAAKRRVFGQVAIDAEAGPSEVLIVADAAAPVRFLAADLIAQAEHEERASVVLVTPSESCAREVCAELERQLVGLPREAVARQALREHGAVVCTRDLEEAFEIANRYAAEHLQVMVENPGRWLDRIRHAGAVFLGPSSPVPAGDYVAGPSHCLPTGGTARFFSVVGVEDFLRRTSLIELSEAGVRQVGAAGVRLAELEGLEGHARALRLRLDAPAGEPSD